MTDTLSGVDLRDTQHVMSALGPVDPEAVLVLRRVQLARDVLGVCDSLITRGEPLLVAAGAGRLHLAGVGADLAGDAVARSDLFSRVVLVVAVTAGDALGGGHDVVLLLGVVQAQHRGVVLAVGVAAADLVTCFVHHLVEPRVAVLVPADLDQEVARVRRGVRGVLVAFHLGDCDVDVVLGVVVRVVVFVLAVHGVLLDVVGGDLAHDDLVAGEEVDGDDDLSHVLVHVVVLSAETDQLSCDDDGATGLDVARALNALDADVAVVDVELAHDTLLGYSVYAGLHKNTGWHRKIALSCTITALSSSSCCPTWEQQCLRAEHRSCP